MFTRCLIAAGISLVFGMTQVAAQTCGGIYTVQSGDTLSQIADAQYKDARKCSAIHQNNLPKIGENLNSIRLGSKLALTCIGGLPTGLEGGTDASAATPVESAVVASSSTASAAVQVAAVDRKIKLLTADDYAPFTDRKLPGGGMITELVTAALNSNSKAQDFGIYVVNDWAAYLDPLLTDAVLDLDFPWFKPDCASMPDSFRCAKLNFSEPMFEVLMRCTNGKAARLRSIRMRIWQAKPCAAPRAI